MNTAKQQNPKRRATPNKQPPILSPEDISMLYDEALKIRTFRGICGEYVGAKKSFIMAAEQLGWLTDK